jgi:Fe-S-cluster-containing hydrogenase component 2
MAKVLTADPEKCTGCRLCELVCSVKHEGVSNPARSRIKIAKWEWTGEYAPITCQLCQPAPCQEICPADAISRLKSGNRMVINYDICTTCQACIDACPWGAISLDPVNDRVILCDLCNGDPQCVRFCQTGALQYIDASEASDARQSAVAERYHSIMQEIAAALGNVQSTD